MKTQEIKIEKATLIDAGNYQVSIGTFDVGDVAIMSKYTGDFVKVKDIKKGGKLKKIKILFRLPKGETTFNFTHMMPDTTRELIKLLRK